MENFFENHLVPSLISAVVGGVASIWAYVKARPKEKIEMDGGIVDNAKKVLEMSEDIAERLHKQLQKSDEIITELKEKLTLVLQSENSCKKALKAAEIELAEFQRKYREQKAELETLEEKWVQLRHVIDENEKLKAIHNDINLN